MARLSRWVRARKWAWRGLLLGLALFGVGQIGSGFYIYAKAAFAEELLERAWGGTLEDGAPQGSRLWADTWPDTWPVARLVFPQYGVDLALLEGVDGEGLAFAPGRVSALARPGKPGTAIIAALIAAQGDSHFRFLEKVQTGDEFWIENKDGSRHRYAAVELTILDSRAASIGEDKSAASLVLLTCYPLDRLLAGGPLRYLVFAGGAGSA